MKEEDLATIIVAILVAVALIWVYVLQPIVKWISQNWIPLTIGIIIIAIGGLAFYIKVLLPTKEEIDEKLRKEEATKKSIIRKRLLKERANQLEGLGLTDEEKEFQLDQW